LIILIILGEEYKLWSSSLCSFLQKILWLWNELDHEIFADLHVFGLSDYEKLVLLCRVSVCMRGYVCVYSYMCRSLAAGLLSSFWSYSVFKTKSILERCPVNMNSLDPSGVPKSQNGYYLGNGSNDSDYNSVIY
jgi:hypothetical protein